MNRYAPEFNQNMPALNKSMADNSLEYFMAELLQDQRLIRGDSDDEAVILVADNAKLSSNASQFSRDGTVLLRPSSFPEGMGAFAYPKKTHPRSSDSSIHKDASLTPTSRWATSSREVPKKDDGLTPPRRLPEHTDSFMIHRQKFRGRGGFIIEPLDGFISCADNSFKNRNLTTSSQDIEIDADCNPHRRGRFAVPSSLQRLPYDRSPKPHLVPGDEY
jgi:hypothetical protein